MAGFTPWYTSDDLIASVKRKISFPVSQNTFSNQDILDFATEEMMISQVPSILQYHEEYFTFPIEVELVANKKRYPIPDRAIGLKLRDLFYKDTNGNLFEMTRIAEDDQAFFQRSMGSHQTIAKYFVQGNDIVLTPNSIDNPTGSLLFIFYIRPNRLVPNERAAIISSFSKTITITNANIVAGDTVTINGTVFTAVAGGATGNEFNIGGTSAITATNLAATITAADIIDSATATTGIVTLVYEDLANTEISVSNDTGTALQSGQGVVFEEIPAIITNGEVIDFLQTRPGHKMIKYDVEIPATGVSSTTINFNEGDVPTDLVVGDYICLANECIIPQIPTDLHTALAERTGARILAAIGDQQGLAASNQKIQEIEARQSTILNNRVEGSNPKVRSRTSLLSMGKMTHRRRW